MPRSVLAVLALLTVSCASPAPKTAVHAPVLVPGPDETIAVKLLIVLIDSSSSVRGSAFRDEKSLAESFARAMPDGDYEAGSIAFGGFERDTAPVAPFNRPHIVAETTSIPHLAEGTPIHKALAEAGTALKASDGRAAIVLYSDGLPTDEIGREVDPQLSYDAVAAIQKNYPGELCIHTVQTGIDPDGAAFLRRLAVSTECGSFRTANDVTTVAALQQFERDVFIGAADTTPDVAAAPGDRDADGVIDANDLCPGTPRGAHVDSRGCWVARGLQFATDSAAIDGNGRQSLDEVAEVLRDNPDLRVRIGGHTDSTASDAYNLALSDRRAAAARSYLASAGIDPSRLDAKGYGESNPAADNRNADGRAQNRRTEIEVLD